MSRFIVLDIAFYANSLNYDQGSGNVQELKKITKWDGKQYTMVSRYALRYSILHHGNQIFGNEKWPLAGNNELNNDKGVVQASGDSKQLIKIFPEFDLFGYMMTESKQSANTRSSTATLSHAVSLVPFNYDNHFNANLDVAKRAMKEDKEKPPINPFPVEEHYTYYVYSIVIDLNRVGFDEKGESVLSKEDKEERIEQLLDSVITLKRQIKGRTEDLSPKVMLIGLYGNKPYQSFKDRICLADEYQEEVIEQEENVENGTKKVRRTVKTNKPLFKIYGTTQKDNCSKEEIKEKVKNFVGQEDQEEKEEVLFSKADEIEARFPT